MDIVVFKLGLAADGFAHRRFGLDLAQVREVLRLTRVTPVPLTPPCLFGAMHVRGNVLPVIDLAQLLGERPSRPAMGATCLRVQRDTQQLLLHVVRVEEVLEVEGEPPPTVAGELVARVQATARGPLPLLSLEAIVDTVNAQLDELLVGLRGYEEEAR